MPLWGNHPAVDQHHPAWKTHPPCHALQDALDAVEDVREYDVPFHMRFAIDTDVRCGHWYTVRITVSPSCQPCKGGNTM